MKRAIKEIDPRQIVAARGLLHWSREDLASAMEMTSEGIKKIENGVVRPRTSTLDTLFHVFEDRGVEFLESCGVRLKDDMLRVIEDDEPYVSLLDDVFHTMKDSGGEVLFAYICNRLSPPSVIESDLRMRHLGIQFRSLIEEGDTYCLFPLREYRWIPSRFFQNNSQVVYGGKVGTMIKSGDTRKVVIIKNDHYAETQRRLFNALWENSKMPPATTAPQTYE